MKRCPQASTMLSGDSPMAWYRASCSQGVHVSAVAPKFVGPVKERIVRPSLQ